MKYQDFVRKWCLIFIAIFVFIVPFKVYANSTNIVLENVSIEENSSTTDASIVSFNDNTVQLNTTFHHLNDYVIYKLSLINNDSIDYTIETITDNNTNPYIVYEYDKHENEQFNQGDSKDILIKVIYKNELHDISIRDQNHSVTISLALVDEEGHPTSDDIIINPSTGNNYIIPLLLLLFVIIMLIIALKIKKMIVKIFIFILLLITLTIMIVKAAEYTMMATMNNTIHFLDKMVVTIDGSDESVVAPYGSTIGELQPPVRAGFTFDNWYSNNQVCDPNTVINSDMELEARYNIITYTISYELNDGSVSGNPTDFNVQSDSITLNNPTKEGYTFIGWTGSNGDAPSLNVVIPTGSTENRNYIANFTANTDTPYKVIHHYRNLNGGFDTIEVPYTGTTGDTVVAPLRPQTGFENPNQKNITIVASGDAYVEYEYERIKVLLTINQIEDIETTFTTGEYDYGTEITLTAKDKEGYTFEKWSNNSTNNPLVFNLEAETTISPIYQINNYNITFNTVGGNSIDGRSVAYNTALGELPTPIKENSVFINWYKESTYDNVVTSETIVKGDMTLYAKWMKSIALAELSTNSITLTRGQEETITITNLAELGEGYTFSSSDSTIASVDQDGKVTANGKGTAVITITGSISGDTKTVSVTVNAQQFTVHFNVHGGSDVGDMTVEENTAIGTLPTTEKSGYDFVNWYKESTYNTVVTTETIITSETTFHAKWFKGVKYAELEDDSFTLTREDEATINIINANSLDEEFTFSSSNSTIASVDTNGKITANAKGTATITIIGTTSGETKTVSVTVNAKDVTVQFNTYGGSNVNNMTVEENTAIGTLPTTEKSGYDFVNWYKESTYNTVVTAETVVSESTTFHAKWFRGIKYAELESNSFTLTREDETNINITNANSLDEEFTFSSSDSTIASVDTNGKITANAKGTATITITGTTSGETKTISVTVNAKEVDVHFNVHGGSDVADMTVEENTAIGTLPTTERSGYDFVNWYKESTYNTVVTTETVITEETTFHAKWFRGIKYAEIEKSSLNIKKSQEQTINITNANTIEEAYTFSSSNDTIASVDANGKVTANNNGNAVITITGTTSGDTKTVNVTVYTNQITVEFNTHGGSSVNDINMEENTAIGTLPTTEKEGYDFVNWYKESTYNTVVTPETIVPSSTTFHAKWFKGVKYAELEDDSFTLTREDEATINIINANSLDEAYTFSSSDSTIASVDTNGKITANAKGTAVITITGTTSGETKTVSVTVNAKQVTVEFNTHDGTPVSSVTIEENTAIGTINTTTRDNYIFENWYKESTYDNVVTAETIVTTSTTFHAKWLKSIALAELSANSITLTRGQEETITITNLAELGEGYTFSSSDSTIASVDQNGKVTANGKGTATITILGTTSGKTKTVSVTVNAQQVTVHFNVHGGSDVDDMTVEENTAIGTLPTTERSGYDFVNWYKESTYNTVVTTETVITEETTFHAKWFKGVKYAELEDDSFTLTREEETNINIINANSLDEAYTFSSSDSTIASVDTNGKITANAKGTTTITITGTTSGETKTVSVTVNAKEFAVHFNSHGGSSANDMTVEENTAIGSLPETTRSGYDFVNWYKESTYNTVVTTETVITEEVTFHAKWFRGIKYAELESDSFTLTREDEANINITNANTLEEAYTFSSSDSTIASVNANGKITANAKGSAVITITGTTSGETKTVNVTVNAKQVTVEFNTHDGTPVSSVTIEENTAIGTINTTTRDNYIFENWYKESTYDNVVTAETIVTTSTTFHAKWMKSIALAEISDMTLTREDQEAIVITNSSEIGENYTAQSSDATIASVSNGVVTANGKGTATITLTGSTTGKTKTFAVTVNAKEFDVHFNVHGGSDVADMTVEENTAIGTLPTTERSGYDFVNWYKESTYNTVVTTETVITAEATFHAKWFKGVKYAELEDDSFTLTREDEATINIINANSLDEAYTFSSSDSTIASVDTNGKITANAKGSATITITGTTSGETKTVNVTVNAKQVTVEFNTHDGTPVSSVTIEENTAIGTINTTTRDNYIFENWYKESTYDNVVTAETIVTTSTTFHAKWLKSIALAEISNMTLTREDQASIVITNSSEIGENYTVASSDSTIASVSNGVITANSKGTATITLTGSTTGKTKIFTVTVNGKSITINFNTHGGSPVSSITMEENTPIGNMDDSTLQDYYFEGWYTEETGGVRIYPSAIPTISTTYHAHWTPTITLATVSPDSISMTVGNTTQISVTGPNGMETYTFTSNNENVATVTSQGLVTGEDAGTTTITISGDKSNETITINVTINPQAGSYLVTLDANSNTGSVDPTSVTVNNGSAIGTIPTPTNTDTTLGFAGWYTDPDNGDLVDDTFVPTSNTTIFAHWAPIICRKVKAEELHQEQCSQTTTGCASVGYGEGAYITYGQVSKEEEFQAGDAFDCVVNIDRNNNNEETVYRFYYLTENNDNAVLFLYNNFDGTNGIDYQTAYLYSEALTKLPTTTQWNNIPVTYDNNTYAGRFATNEEIMDACDLPQASSAGELNDCQYLLEGTRFAHTSAQGYRNGYWLKENGSSSNNPRIITETRTRNGVSLSTSSNGVRPVIEVPMYQMDQREAYTVTLKLSGGNIGGSTSDIEIVVFDGDEVGTLPTPERNVYTFNGWYTTISDGIEVNEHYIVHGNIDIFARWTKNIGYIISFESNGGDEIEDIEVQQGEAIGELPVTEKDGYIFEGWYTEEELQNKIDDTYTPTGNIKLYANWTEIPANVVAIRDRVNMHTTLADAMSSASTTGDVTTIKLVQDVSEAIEVGNTHKIKLDLNGHSMSTSKLTNDKGIITNVGTVEVQNGTLEFTGTNSGHAIRNNSNGVITIKNVTMRSSGSSGAVDNETGAQMTLIDSVVECTGTKQGVYNNGGTLTIRGNSTTISNTTNSRATVHNLNNGTLTFESGTINSQSFAAVYSEGGTLTIGVENGLISSSPEIINNRNNTSSHVIVVKENTTLNIYDGSYKSRSHLLGITTAGGNNPTINTSIDTAADIETYITDKEDDSEVVVGTEQISSRTYNTFTLSFGNKYVISLDANGGTVSPLSIKVNYGDSITGLPTPTNGLNTFLGWYDENDQLIEDGYTPNSNMNLHAVWDLSNSEEIVNFNMTNDAMTVYYNYIDTWKASSTNFPSWSDDNKSPTWALDASENTPMMANFNNYNCQCADNQCSTSGSVQCDQPKGYSTGASGTVRVYLSSEENKEKGTEVTYAKVQNGVIYNLIPNQVYYWELDSDSSVHGYVKALGERRILNTGDVRNTRDLGGLPVDVDDDGVIDGHLAYGRLFRGIRLNSSSSVIELTRLGINSELDLREANSDSNQISRYNRIEAQNYYVNPYNYATNPNNTTEQEREYYNWTRAAVQYAMKEIVEDKNLFFHCRIGTDRTGTVAYVLEGLLGVPNEDRIRDYELSFFYGLVRIHRYHNEKPGSSIGTGKERFVYMYNFMPDNDDIYDWYMYGTTDRQYDEDLIAAFRSAMIE